MGRRRGAPLHAADLALTAPITPRRAHVWIGGRSFDLRWLIGSALIGPPILAWVYAGGSSLAINLGVTAIIGGPHLFSTYIATYADPRFRRQYAWFLVAATILVPSFVAYWTFVDFQILLSVFIFAASAHVLQQNAFITDVYRARAGLPERRWARWVDYGLLMICIYPVASYKLVHGTFALGDTPILIPAFLMTPATYWGVWIFFGAMLALWLRKSWLEQREGVLNVPKTVLIAVTTGVAFVAPMAASGADLELAFQCVNAWHSIQYLGLVWWIQSVRKERGLIESRFVAAISGPGRAASRFYGLCFGITLALLGGLIALANFDPWGLEFDQYYYLGVLSCLLIHYVLDAYLFAVSARRDTDPTSVPYAALVMDRG